MLVGVAWPQGFKGFVSCLVAGADGCSGCQVRGAAGAAQLDLVRLVRGERRPCARSRLVLACLRLRLRLPQTCAASAAPPERTRHRRRGPQRPFEAPGGRFSSNGGTRASAAAVQPAMRCTGDLSVWPTPLGAAATAVRTSHVHNGHGRHRRHRGDDVVGAIQTGRTRTGVRNLPNPNPNLPSFHSVFIGGKDLLVKPSLFSRSAGLGSQ